MTYQELEDMKGDIFLLQSRVTYLESLVHNMQTPEEPADAFDDFWALYPRKVGKPLARKAFAKAEADQAIAGLASWLGVDAFNPNQKYIPHASTWLNQRCYLDKPVPYGGFVKPIIGGKSETRKALDSWLDG